MRRYVPLAAAMLLTVTGCCHQSGCYNRCCDDGYGPSFATATVEWPEPDCTCSQCQPRALRCTAGMFSNWKMGCGLSAGSKCQSSGCYSCDPMNMAATTIPGSSNYCPSCNSAAPVLRAPGKAPSDEEKAPAPFEVNSEDSQPPVLQQQSSSQSDGVPIRDARLNRWVPTRF